MGADREGDAAAQTAAAAAEMFGAVLPQAETYARLLTDVGRERGIVGPAEAARIWDRHLLNCGVISGLVPRGCWLADLGSGAGLPGIVLAMLLPDVRVSLVEPMARRVEFLRECAEVLGLENAEVIRGRAEELAGKLAVDVVTSRAVAPLGKLAGLSARLARPGGRVLAMKGESAAVELARSRPALARLGICDARVEVARNPGGTISATVVTFTIPTCMGSGRAPVLPPGSSAALAGAPRSKARGRGGAGGSPGGRKSGRRGG